MSASLNATHFSSALIRLPLELKFYVAAACGRSEALALALTHTSFVKPCREALLRNVWIKISLYFDVDFDKEENTYRFACDYDKELSMQTERGMRLLHRLSKNPFEASLVRSLYLDFTTEGPRYIRPPPLRQYLWETFMSALKMMKNLRHLHFPRLNQKKRYDELLDFISSRVLSGICVLSFHPELYRMVEEEAMKRALRAYSGKRAVLAVDLTREDIDVVRQLVSLHDITTSAFGYSGWGDWWTVYLYPTFYEPRYWDIYLSRILALSPIPFGSSKTELIIAVGAEDIYAPELGPMTQRIAGATYLFPNVEKLELHIVAEDRPGHVDVFDNSDVLQRLLTPFAQTLRHVAIKSNYDETIAPLALVARKHVRSMLAICPNLVEVYFEEYGSYLTRSSDTQSSDSD